MVAAAPAGLASSFNLGAADFYPDTSGKVGDWGLGGRVGRAGVGRMGAGVGFGCAGPGWHSDPSSDPSPVPDPPRPHHPLHSLTRPRPLTAPRPPPLFLPRPRAQVMAARHLMARFGAPAPACSFLCDDDNDLQLAAEVGRAFLPSITSVRGQRVGFHAWSIMGRAGETEGETREGETREGVGRGGLWRTGQGRGDQCGGRWAECAVSSATRSTPGNDVWPYRGSQLKPHLPP